MLTHYRIKLACLIFSLGASAHASQLLQDENAHSQNTSVHLSDTDNEKKAALERRLFWLYEKNPTLPESTMRQLIKNAYEAMGIPYEAPQAQPPHHVTGCWQ